jgi:flagellar motor switch protein FliN
MEKITAFDMKTSVAESVINLFDTMFSMKVELYETDSETGLDGFRMTGSLSLAGDVMGTMAIQVSDVFARLMTAAMMGIELEEIESEEEVKDVIREACNIVGGSLKSALSDLGLSSEISIPSITTGNDFAIEILNMDRYERFIFRCMEYDIFLEVCVKIDESANIPSQTESDAGDAVESQEDIDNLLQSMRDSADDNVAEVLDKPGTINDSVDEKVSPEINDQTKTINDAVDNKGSAGVDETDGMLGFILDIPLEVTVEFGQTKMMIDDLLRVGQGSVIKLEEFEGETLRILANSKLIAKGEVVVDKGKYGIRITEIASRQKRIESMK